MKQQNFTHPHANKIHTSTQDRALRQPDNFHYVTTFIQIICLFVGLIVLIVSKYGFVFYSAAMIPGVVSVFVDKNEYKCASATLCTFNLIGVLPYVVQLMHGDGSTSSVQSMISNIKVWFIIYGTALLGQVIYWIVPLLVAKLYIIKSSIEATLHASERDRLCSDWRIKSDDPYRGIIDESPDAKSNNKRTQ